MSIALLLMGLVISMGAALGSSRFLSDIILRIGEFIRQPFGILQRGSGHNRWRGSYVVAYA